MIHTLQELVINSESSMLEALEQMDKLMRKLLIVIDEKQLFVGMLSIGDLQRTRIKKMPLNTAVGNILRSDAKVTYSDDAYEITKATMLKYRMEYMPVVDKITKKITNIIFWEDIIGEIYCRKKNELLKSYPVVIMAGGKGTRLKPFTNIIPKPLLPLGGKSIIEIIINNFTNYGIREFYTTVNYKAKMIQQYFEELQPNYDMHFILESKPLGTGGSLHLLRKKIQGTFFVTNCDIIIDDDYSEILNYHRVSRNSITAVAAVKTYNIPYGTFEIGDGGILQALYEKPNLSFFVNTGFYILESEVLDLIPSDTFYHITSLMEKVMLKGGRVGVFPVSEKSWLDIGVWEEYNKTQKFFENKITFDE